MSELAQPPSRPRCQRRATLARQRLPTRSEWKGLAHPLSTTHARTTTSATSPPLAVPLISTTHRSAPPIATATTTTRAISPHSKTLPPQSPSPSLPSAATPTVQLYGWTTTTTAYSPTVSVYGTPPPRRPHPSRAVSPYQPPPHARNTVCAWLSTATILRHPTPATYTKARSRTTKS